MIDKVSISLIYDNIDGTEKGLTKDFGFAALIEFEDKKILFDTGTNSNVLLYNLKKLDISIPSINAVIMSHNHYDHTDGLPGILKENPKIPVYLPKNWDADFSFKGINIPNNNRKYVKGRGKISELSDKLYLTDSLLSNDYGGIYEQAIFIKTNNQLILLCGCCHPGLSRFLKEGEKLGLLNALKINIMGGFHNFTFNEQEANELNPKCKKIICCHCTSNTRRYKEQFKEKCTLGIVGKCYEFH